MPMGTVEPSRQKRARFRGTLVKVKLSPNRKERIRLAKASVKKFHDELVLAGYDPKKMEKLLASWDGNPKTDPLEALINPKPAEQGELALSNEAKAAGFSTTAPDPRDVKIAEAGKRDWLHRFDAPEVKT